MTRRENIAAKLRGLWCNIISRNQAGNFILPNGTGCLTIFHDYEGEYSRKGLRDISYEGVNRMLDIEEKYQIKTTYNTVGRLINDVPEIISRILSNGHEIASHTYKHEVMIGLSKREIIEDIKKTRDVFSRTGLDLAGFRSPKGRWDFKLMDILLDQGFKWSAELDKSPYPYVLRKKNKSELIRLPIVMDDWGYQSKIVDPEQMFTFLMNAIKKIEIEKNYGAIGFHPWVQAMSEGRLEVYERFISELKRINISIVPFGEMAKHLIKLNHNV